MLANVLEDVGVKTLRYLYDFGDGWEHKIKIERFEEFGIAPRAADVFRRAAPDGADQARIKDAGDGVVEALAKKWTGKAPANSKRG